MGLRNFWRLDFFFFVFWNLFWFGYWLLLLCSSWFTFFLYLFFLFLRMNYWRNRVCCRSKNGLEAEAFVVSELLGNPAPLSGARSGRHLTEADLAAVDMIAQRLAEARPRSLGRASFV